MANSDNVLRGGLTPKHIDVPELLKHTRFEAVVPEILEGTPAGDAEKVYRSPAPDFELSCIQINANHSFKSTAAHAADILMVLEGTAEAAFAEGELSLKKGDVFLAKAGAAYQLTGSAILYKATVPL